jgi:hypothetical protein
MYQLSTKVGVAIFSRTGLQPAWAGTGGFPPPHQATRFQKAVVDPPRDMASDSAAAEAQEQPHSRDETRWQRSQGQATIRIGTRCEGDEAQAGRQEAPRPAGRQAAQAGRRDGGKPRKSPARKPGHLTKKETGETIAASLKEDADRSPRLEQLAIGFVLDAAGVHRARSSGWRALRNDDGTWSLTEGPLAAGPAHP